MAIWGGRERGREGGREEGREGRREWQIWGEAWFVSLSILAPPSPHVKPLVTMIFVLQKGWIPLMIASQKGHFDVVKALIEAGANVNHTDEVFTSNCTLYMATVYIALHVVPLNCIHVHMVHTYVHVIMMPSGLTHNTQSLEGYRASTNKVIVGIAVVHGLHHRCAELHYTYAWVYTVCTCIGDVYTCISAGELGKC